jgi:hypothetical protein
MKYILDKIDKEEKQAAKKRKREESVEQKRSKQNATKLSALLFKHKEQLKAEILKKRALLDKDLQIEVQVRGYFLSSSARYLASIVIICLDFFFFFLVLGFEPQGLCVEFLIKPKMSAVLKSLHLSV